MTPDSYRNMTPDEMNRWWRVQMDAIKLGISLPSQAQAPLGCICPLESELTCGSGICPRKPISASGTLTRRAETTGSVGEADSGPTAKGGDVQKPA